MRESSRNKETGTNEIELAGVLDLETLAIIFSLDRLDHLVESFKSVVVITDHRNIVWLLAQKNIRRVRWALRLSMYHNLTFCYQKGSTMLTSDCLSRLVTIQHEAESPR